MSFVPSVKQQSEVCLPAVKASLAPRIAYLVSRYPAVSHTFILREVIGLRKLGFAIETASINPPDRPSSELPPLERLEAESTFYVKRQGPLRALKALFLLLCRRPRRFLGALAFALGLGNGSPTEMLTNCFYFAEAAVLGSWLEDRNLKHLHIHFGNAASTVAIIAQRAYPITFSMTIHGPDEFYEVRRHSLRQKMASARFVCCIGAYTRSQVMKISDPDNWDKYRVAPLGVDPGEFRPRPFRRSPECWEIVCVGRLTPAKGQMILLRALKRLVADGRSVHCRFIGDGPDRSPLMSFTDRELPAGVVTFQGAVNADRIVDMLHQADLFVLPSFAEGVPVALMEAMSMEIPCISTMITGVPELIRHGVDGLLVSPSDEIELASTISLLMDDEALRRRLGAAGRVRVMDRYNQRNNILALAHIMKCELPNT